MSAFAKLAPLTKLILAVVVSVWSFLLTTVPALATLVLGELALAAVNGARRQTAKAIGALLFFAAGLGAVQYLAAGDVTTALVAALRMTAMTIIFPPILATTRLQDIATALVTQCRIPYEYAFMFTAALRFIPDFIAESRAIMEAQQCRGYKPGRGLRRLAGYTAVLQPLVLGAISRSEAMAMSLEMRGFGQQQRSFYHQVSLNRTDLTVLALLAAVTAALAYRFILNLIA